MSDNFDDLFGAQQEHRGTGDEFLTVGIGASAGGIQALKTFFSQVPADSDMAYVVILHMSPDHESRLAQVLQTTAAIPVTQVVDRVKVEPNNVYVISPNKSLSMLDGHLALSEMTRIEERRAPVDIFFRTLAESHHSRAVCVILSGSGANGSMGMKRVKEYGGVCIVQDPAEAEYTDMPRNSIATGLVDYILPVAKIPERIIAYKNHLGSVSIPAGETDRLETDDHALRDIFTQLRVRTGHDFANYKRPTVLRRIERRISVQELPDLPSYAKVLREDSSEAQALLKDLLISVTNFFRDPEPFKALESKIIPKLFEGKGTKDHVRVWVAGCATGEEAYSIAMLLSEAVDEAAVDTPAVQVFATDIDEWAISKARDGFYTLNDAADVSPERLRRFFIKEGDGYRVRRELRETVLFAAHNLIKDPPFSHIDLITCRNLMIYLNRSAQQRVMEVLHFALSPGRFLFLGTSESIEGSNNLFTAVDKENHIFQSRPVEARLPLPMLVPSIAHPAATFRQEETLQAARAHERLSYLDLHQRLLEEYAPPSILANEDYEVMHLSERVGQYLHVGGGEPSNNLLKMIRPELRFELRTALYQAVHSRINIEARNLPIVIDGKEERVNLIVRPVLREEDPTRGFILVLFQTPDEESKSDTIETISPPAEPIARQLEEELMRVRSQVRATIEQHELQQEELKASNEELQAMNEELRSSAEELETSKEELQSVNEELTTVNQELKIKIEELSQSNNDFQNLMNSAEIGTIFLDRSLRVKLFTPRTRDMFNLIPADIGRPLSDITNKLSGTEVISDVERVLETLVTIDREVQTSDNHWYHMKILPYRTADDRINGAIMTFTDITARRQAEAALRAKDDMVRRELEQRVVERTQQLEQANEAMKVEAQERRQSEEVRIQLLQQLVRAQEDERRRIARDLHDQMGQQLTALRLQLENLRTHLKADKQAAAEIHNLQGMLVRLESDLDFLAWQLRPAALDDIGLRESLADYIKGWSKHIHISAEFHSSGLDHQRLPAEIETNLYRIAQEALNNVYKHSKGDRVEVLLELRDNQVALVIEDNGKGFDPQAKSDGMGLHGIRERATLIGGKLEIESSRGQGATLFIRVPINSP